MRGQLYHGHYLVISPLHGHGEVANESPLISPRTLSIVGALVLLKRRSGKKMWAPLLGLPKSIYYIFLTCSCADWAELFWRKCRPRSADNLLVPVSVEVALFSCKEHQTATLCKSYGRLGRKSTRLYRYYHRSIYNNSSTVYKPTIFFFLCLGAMPLLQEQFWKGHSE